MEHKIEWNKNSSKTYKSVSSWFSGLPVRDDDSFFDVAVDLKVFTEWLVCRVIGKTPHEQLGPHRVLLIAAVVVAAARGHVGNDGVLKKWRHRLY